MKKLLLHIGYPKTATTTLQEGLFLQLHNLGKINFLGRTVTSSHKKIFSKGFNQDWVVDFKRYFIMGKKLPLDKYLLSDSLLNVISDEDLTLPAIFNEIQFGFKRDPLSFINILRELLSDADEIIVLMTIRNQSELLSSCYSQKFGFIYANMPDFSFEKFVKGSDGLFNPETYRAFNFIGVAESYAVAFNAKVVPLLFEDLKNDKRHFFDQLALVLGINVDDLVSIAGNAHFRNKIAKGAVISKASFSPNSISKFLSKLFGSDPFLPFFQSHWYLKKNAITSLINKLLVTKVIVQVPNQNSDLKDFIKVSFSDSNLMFCKKFALDIEKFKKYNYL